MSNRDEFEKWFSIEYGTPVSVLVSCRTEDGYTMRTSTNIYYSWKAYQAATQSQQSRIDLLESPIREFLINVDENNRGEQELDIDHHIYNLRNLMENKS